VCAARTKLFSRQTLTGEKARYLLVGAVNTVFGYVVFVTLLATVGAWLKGYSDSPSRLLATIGEHYYLVAQWLGWILAVPVSAVMMKRFAFRSRGRALHQIGRAYLVYLPAQGLSFVLLWLLVQLLHIPPQIAVIIIVVVTTVLTYIGHKYFTFRVPLEVGEVPPEELLD
jgi:putative flippase GtrA